MVDRYGAGGSIPRVDPPNPLEQPAPLRTIGPVRAVTTPLGDVVAAPFSVGADTGCTNANLRVTGGGHFTARVGIGVCPSSTNAGLQVNGPGNSTARIISTSTGTVVYITPFDDTSIALRISNAADSIVRHSFFGNGDVGLANGSGSVIVGTDPGGSETLRVASSLRLGNSGVSQPFATQFIIAGTPGVGGARIALVEDDTTDTVGLILAQSGGVEFGSFSAHDVFFRRSNAQILKLTATAFSPVSSGLRDLGTSTLPWAIGYFTELFSGFVGSGQNELLRLNSTSATGGPHIAFYDSGGTRRSYIQHDFNATVLLLNQEQNGPIAFYTNSTQRWQITGSGHFIASTDNSFDIGTSGANRPRDIFLAGKLDVGAVSGGGVLQLRPGTSADHTYMEFFADSAAPTTRFAYIGYGSGGTEVLDITQQRNAALQFYTNNTARIQISGSGHLLWNTDNTLDIGASGASRPRDVFIGRDLVVGGTITGTVDLKARNSNVTAAGTGGATAETDLMTHTLPTMVTGDFIEVTASGSITGTADTKIVRLYVGSTIVASIGTIAAGTTGSWFFKAHIIKDSTNLHRTILKSALTLGVTVESTLAFSTAQELSGSVVKVTGTTTNSADEVTQELMTIMLYKA